MPPDDGFSQWAALFLRSYGDDAGLSATGQPEAEPAPGAVPVPQPTVPGAGSASIPAPAREAEGARAAALTQSALELLRAVDAGGVPAFVTNSLRQIARDNGIDVSAHSTPNEIVAAIRNKR